MVSLSQILKEWNIRGAILFSLSLQISLILFAPLRKRTRGLFLSLIIWLCYLLADSVATYSIGTISKTQKCKSTITPDDYLMSFWGPFLLLHLGGPDTITALSLEDNELWRRHLFGLISQAFAAAYVFSLTFQNNTLRLPTILVFLAGIIKYGERTYALYLASINNFRKSMISDPDPGPNYAKLVEEHASWKKAGLPAEIIIVPEPEDDQESGDSVKKVKHDYVDDSENDLEEVQKGFFFFNKFKGLIVDMIYSFADRNLSRQYFDHIAADKAFRVIEVELHFMYEDFYTKAPIVRRWSGIICRIISFASVVWAFVLFVSAEKHEFDEVDVVATYALLYVALALDFVAFFRLIFADQTAAASSDEAYCKDNSRAAAKPNAVLQLMKIFILKPFNENILVHYLSLRRPRWIEIKKQPYTEYKQLSTSFLWNRWTGTISGFNLLTYCLHRSTPQVANIDPDLPVIARVIQRHCFRFIMCLKGGFYEVGKHLGLKDILDKLMFKEEHPFPFKLWDFIFNELKRKSHDGDDDNAETIQRKCSARGEWVLQEVELNEKEVDLNEKNVDLNEKKVDRKKLLLFVDPNEVAFDQSLLLWHIATHLCYTTEQEGDHEHGVDGEEKRELSMLLSDYMLYLLIMQPTIMSAVAGIGQKRFQDTCAEAMNFFSKRKPELKQRNEEKQKEACKLLMKVPTDQKPIDVKGDRSKSLLFDACRLAKELNKITKEKKWEIICQVWVEMLSYAASYCRPTAFVQELSKGGQLISFVWLLMVQLGLGRQFQIKQGHARAKLIVAS